MLIGHQKQWRFLKRAAELGRIPHGILFCGQEKLGKKTLAVELAKLLNCSSIEFTKKPCQICRSCQDIQKMIHPDFVLIEPISPQREIQISQTSRSALCNSIGIKQIRDLIWKLSLRSYPSFYKIAIIDKAHLMTQEAQSCFLKLLEEPKGRTVLILISEYPETLLPTIISRIQKLKFSPVEKTEIENYIISRGGLPENAKQLASISFGKPGLAIDFLSAPQTLESRKKLISDLKKIVQSDLSFRFQYAKNLIEKGPDFSNILNTWLEYFRSMFLAYLQQNKDKNEKNACPVGSRLWLDSFGENFSQYSLSKIIKIISLIQSTDFLMSTTNTNPKLAIELLLMEI